jgi:ubiquinone/menaquinone biosynthesis C-methylase UbiE
MNEQTVDLEAIKQVQQKIWSEGDFSMVAGTVILTGEKLAEALDILPGDRVLDVACGSGNATLPAARRAWGNTVGLDYVPELLERGRERAAAERLEVEFVEGDAEDLPFDDAEFDVVLSSYGAMFAPDQQKAADELLRVCKPGGRIGMANWTPDGYVGQMFATTVKHAPLPPGVLPPTLWGTEDRLRELFGDRVSSIDLVREEIVFRFRSPAHWLEFFRTYMGPTKAAFERVGPEGEDALASDLLGLIERFNTAGERAMRVPSEYLQVIATRV